MDSPLRPTMRTIALEAGVTAACVSMALRGDPRISQKTRDRIQAIASRLKYQTHPHLATLLSQRRTGKAPSARAPLAFITAYSERDSWRHLPMVRDFFLAAEERATDLGYRLDRFWLNEPGQTHRRLSDIMTNRGIHGVLIAPVYAARGHLSLKWENFASMTLGYSVCKPMLHRVCHYQHHTVATALRELKRKGYRKIALVVHRYNNERVDRHWEASFFVHHGNRKNSGEAPRNIPAVWKEESFADWMRQVQPEAIISPHRELYGWLKKLGYRMPEDVAFACLDWSEEMKSCAGVDQNHRLLGATAIELLVAQIQRNERGLSRHPTVTLIEGKWVPGDTI